MLSLFNSRQLIPFCIATSFLNHLFMSHFKLRNEFLVGPLKNFLFTKILVSSKCFLLFHQTKIFFLLGTMIRMHASELDKDVNNTNQVIGALSKWTLVVYLSNTTKQFLP